MGGVFVIKASRRFLDAGTTLNQFIRPLLPLFRKPDLWAFAHFVQKIPLQRPQGDAAVLRQRGGAPVGHARQFRPLLNMV